MAYEIRVRGIWTKCNKAELVADNMLDYMIFYKNGVITGRARPGEWRAI